jgi:hypothetical protein
MKCKLRVARRVYVTLGYATANSAARQQLVGHSYLCVRMRGNTVRTFWVGPVWCVVARLSATRFDGWKRLS